jgi:beta-phosphoglucomutase-like phosphatase (HAD superfamily)
LQLLIFDLNVFSTVVIDYAPLTNSLRQKYGNLVNPMPPDIFSQLSAIKPRISEAEFNELSKKLALELDAIELERIGGLSLNPGVKQGLSSLKPMKVSVAMTTSLGRKAAENFLNKFEIREFVGEIFARDEAAPEDAANVESQLNRVTEKSGQSTDECLFFCNKLSTLKAAKAKKFRTIILPSKNERIDVMLREKPGAMILSLEELPSLLSLESFKETKKETTQENTGSIEEQKNS